MTFKRTVGFWRGLLRDQRGSVGGGGTPGAGDGTGTGQPDDSGDGGAGSLDEAKVNELISKAIGARFKAFETKIAKTFEAASEQILTRVNEALSTIPKPPEGGAPPPDDKANPVVAGLQKQLDAMKAKVEASDAKAEAAEAKQRDAALRARLAEQLALHDIEGTRAQHAIGYLVDAAKRVRYDGDDLVFMDENDAVDLKTGLAEWAKGDEAKLYLPPRGANGSGTPPAAGRKRADANGQQAVPSKAEIGTALMSVLTGGG